ncbi:MAG: putative DNA-binding domain-containing protein [Gammaproteobacteria bacterium]|nr:putative DNA-binding domain-containing protein [Gammaproteobacteria bacterium]
MKLLDFQIEFINSIKHQESDASITHTCNLEIYRNTYQATLLKSLTRTYPLIHKLLGDAYFQQIGLTYIQAEPSRSPNLNEYGAFFKLYLKADAVHIAHPYLAEVAHFEWLCAALPMDLTAADLTWQNEYVKHSLSHILPGKTALLECQYNLLEIIDLCEGAIPAIDLTQSVPLNLLIIVREEKLRLIPLKKPEFKFLSLCQSHTLHDALKIIRVDYQEFSLTTLSPYLF